MKEYRHTDIEQKWRTRWQEQDMYHTPDPADDPAKRDTYYALDMFPGISGSHLHVGHFSGYTLSDVKSRAALLHGKNVLHPMGWDAFGLPVENFAIKNNLHPQKAKDDNKINMREQMQFVAAMYDWDREVDTSAPEYYRWTQWLFLQLYKAGLAYRKEAPVNWCPQDNTVLANEQVVDGECERCGAEVTKKNLKQWFFKITDYADRLEADLKHVNWPERTVKMQRDWIGKSHGMEIDFFIADHPEEKALCVFTTRPDTIFGATFMVIAPEHKLIHELTTPDQQDAVSAYQSETNKKSERERLEAKEKTGVFTGSYAINPASGERIPIWVADYVLATYGTGAIMAVPAHDQRDFDFAVAQGLPRIQVVDAPADIDPETEPFTADGPLINSGEFKGLTTKDAISAIIDAGTKAGWGSASIQYKMRDWLFSRQRYWGAPIPMIYCDACGEVPVPEDQLPLELPETADFKPRTDGRSPLANIAEFVNTTCPTCDKAAKRETDTMDGFVCSSWYFLRYTDPHNTDAAFDPEKANSWMPVDLYVGGAEHSVGHLMYARFFTKFLHDQGLVNFTEPFKELFHPSLIYRDGAKMSKSKGNVVNPNDIVQTFGADSLRCYELFMGPADQAIEWNDNGIEGVYRFLGRVFRMVMENSDRPAPNTATHETLERALHKTIKKVTDDIDNFRFNTAISAMMEFVGDAKEFQLPQEWLEQFLILLAPFAPHLTDECWESLGHTESIWTTTSDIWPIYNPKLLIEDTVEIAVQVNGKLRGTIQVPVDIDKSDLEQQAAAVENVATHLEGKTIKKTIVVPGRLVNFVV